ncbi:hypothetical protein CARN8_1120009 [mine drainage metagenome]|uniref:Uncharacterized protein n=1 Tax=mine drainage metagenome TaxID=410659 RepID=A0A3P3ZLB9_9ZZZZ
MNLAQKKNDSGYNQKRVVRFAVNFLNDFVNNY